MNDREDVRFEVGRASVRRRPGRVPVALRAIGCAVLTGAVLAFAPEALVAQDTGENPRPTANDPSGAGSGDGRAPARGGMIPRDALVDMTRAQSSLLCASEVFLGCMGFDGSRCRSLSESAIERCLLPLPAEIDPGTLDNATLESCPKTVYEEAGYGEDEATACLERALDGS